MAGHISAPTLMRWLKLPQFQAAYREARRAAYSQAVAKLQQGATAAATTLLKVMVDQSTPAAVKVRAAECVMNHSSKASRSKTLKPELRNWNAPPVLRKPGGRT